MNLLNTDEHYSAICVVCSFAYHSVVPHVTFPLADFNDADILQFVWQYHNHVEDSTSDDILKLWVNYTDDIMIVF